ncbi:MAG: DEAD/DEAH box helicase [Ancrocorticia sp.]
MSDLLRALERHAAPGQIAGIIEREARPSRHTQWPEWVPASVLSALDRAGAGQPWIHQAEAARLIREECHTVVATGTGSGKSLAAWVPMLSSLADARGGRVSLAAIHRRPTALYLSPTKALAADQMTSLAGLANAIDPRISVATVDGDTDQPARTWAREHADIIMTNPDFAHHAMLSGQQRWTRLWRGLSMIVIDEFHNYKGMFGAHVAHIVRRILRVAAFYGASPTVVFLSATSADPAQSAHRFLGDSFGDVVAVTEDGSPRGAQQIVLWRCRPVEDKDDAEGTTAGTPTFDAPTGGSVDDPWSTGFTDTSATDSTDKNSTAGVASNSATAGINPISDAARDTTPHSTNARHSESLAVNDTSPGTNSTSTSSPSDHTSHTDTPDPDVELASDDAPRRAANTEAGEIMGLLVSNGARALTFVRSRPGTERVAEIAREWLDLRAPYLAGSVAAYRGGYLPEERRELEEQLREGDMRALATTSALELGIDISGLDAVVVTGWPGTHASFAQQIGRAGRAGRQGLAVFVGRDNPLDQYLLDHPEVIAQTPSEANVFDPMNPNALIPELCAAAAELPLRPEDAAIFGLPDTSLFEDLATDGLLRRRPAGWFWNTSLGVSAHQTVSLRGEGSTVSIVNSADGTILGTVDSARADTTVHPGAIYLHQGVPFEVEELGEDVALVHEHREEEIRTYPREEMGVEIMETEEQLELETGVWARGKVVVSSRVIGYDVRRLRDGLYLGMVPLTMPVRQLHTSATWWTINEKSIKASGILRADIPGALHGAEHASIGLLPLFATCDRWDLGGLSTAAHLGTGQATVIVHDAISGGSGCAERGFQAGREWILATLKTIESCPCISGCPRCIQSPKCGNNNEPLSKSGAILLLKALTQAMNKVGAGTSVP